MNGKGSAKFMRLYNNPEIHRRVGRYCAIIRKYNNITIQEFADMVGTTFSKIKNFEYGTSNDMSLFLQYMRLDGFKRNHFLASIGLRQGNINNGEE